jgi:ferrochelatase
MSFRAEPPWRHGTPPRTAVLLVNLGTPAAPTAAAVRRYLAEFLGDPRVVEIPRGVWWPILHGVILRTRPAKSAAKYASIWTKDGSPLAVWTQRQATLLHGWLGERGHRVDVRMAMRYGEPSVAHVLDALRADNATRVLVLPLYPQYAAATTATVNDAVAAWSRRTRRLPELRFVNDYCDDAGYVEALADSVRAHWQANGRSERLVLSFHGLPQRSLTLGDPYHCQCQKTARLLGERLGLGPQEMLVTFQSRFGRARWLQPYTEPTLRELARQGVRRVDVLCPGFAADCLETLEEIDQEARAAFLGAGGAEFHYIPCLNDRPAWLRALTAIAERHLAGWDTKDAADAADLERQRARAAAMGASG